MIVLILKLVLALCMLSVITAGISALMISRRAEDGTPDALKPSKRQNLP